MARATLSVAAKAVAAEHATKKAAETAAKKIWDTWARIAQLSLSYCGTQRWRLIDPARLQSLAGPSEGVAIYLQAVRNLSALRRNRGWRKPARLLHWWTSRRQPQLSSSALHNAARARNWGAGRSLEHAQIACHASSGQDQGVVQGSFLNLKSLQNEVGCEAYCSTNAEHCSRALIDAPCV